MLITDASEFIKNEFDYLVVGGGTAGLVVACRLAQIGSVKVGVIEAGSSHIGNIDVDTPGPVGKALLSTAGDFSLSTLPQAECFGRRIVLPKGKGLGGSSAVNFTKLDRASSVEYDSIEKLGNPGWNWQEFLHYFKKSQTFHLPSAETAAKLGIRPNPDVHGTNGPIHASFEEWTCDLQEPFVDALKDLGMHVNPDPDDGDNIGIAHSPLAVDANTKRSYAASAYYAPVANQENLNILCGALVTKVELEDAVGGEKRATGAHFLFEGRSYFSKAKREVILAAGALITPQILELSGVGRKDILEENGIKQVIDLPGVGENLQDHFLIPVDFKLRPGYQSSDMLVFDEDVVKQHKRMLDEEGKGLYAGIAESFAYPTFSDLTNEQERKNISALLEAERTVTDKSLLSWPEQSELLRAFQQNERVSPAEIVLVPGLFPSERLPEAKTCYTSIIVIIMHPSSRGAVHIVSADPTSKPQIELGVFGSPSDLEIAKLGIRYAFEIANKGSMKAAISEYISREEIGSDKVSRDPVGDYCRKRVSTTFHWIGTAAMMPREKGGVVSPQLKVYGTSNLRVVDGSVIPIHLSCHNQATIYAIGEKAADLIKADM